MEVKWKTIVDFIVDAPLVTQIDKKLVGPMKVKNDIWSRRELQNACEKLTASKIPKGKHKMVYAKTLVALRAFQTLEKAFCVKVMGRCKNDTCPVCKDQLLLPVFRYKDVGYHVNCVHRWITVSHKFKDPIFGEEYTDSHLKRIDKLTSAYYLHLISVFDLKYDNARIDDDDASDLREERLEIYTDLFERDMAALQEAFEHKTSVATEVVSEHFEEMLQDASRIDFAFVRSSLEEFIHRTIIDGCEEFVAFLLGLNEKLTEWESSEDDEMSQFENEIALVVHGLRGYAPNLVNHLAERIFEQNPFLLTDNLETSPSSSYFMRYSAPFGMLNHRSLPSVSLPSGRHHPSLLPNPFLPQPIPFPDSIPQSSSLMEDVQS